MTEGSIWFKRFYKECKKISNHIKFKRIKYGFYRIYWQGGGNSAYLYEVYKEMPSKGYDIEDLNMKLEDKKYYEEREDNVELIRRIKNFVEGYYDSMPKIKRRIYMFKNNKEFRDTAINGYKTRVVK